MPEKKSKPRKLSKFNKWSVGRAAVLFSKNIPRGKVVDYYLKRYGERWGIQTRIKMEDFLFTPRRGRRPNFGKLFEQQPSEMILQNYGEWIGKKRRDARVARERMKALNQDPEFARKNRERMKALHQDPEFARKNRERMKLLWRDSSWRKQQITLIHEGVQRHWSIIKQGLLESFKAREIEFTTQFERGSDQPKRIAVTTYTPDKRAIENEQRATIQNAIKRLTGEEREAIIATYFEGKSSKKTAEEMGLTIDELEIILTKAHQKLAKKLKGKI